jgi:hypothetical protein
MGKANEAQERKEVVFFTSAPQLFCLVECLPFLIIASNNRLSSILPSDTTEEHKILHPQPFG